jgi:hypothetical protein
MNVHSKNCKITVEDLKNKTLDYPFSAMGVGAGDPGGPWTPHPQCMVFLVAAQPSTLHPEGGKPLTGPTAGLGVGRPQDKFSILVTKR